MALKCAKNDFKHSTVHGDRRSENILGCFFGQILDRFRFEKSYRAKKSDRAETTLKGFFTC